MNELTTREVIEGIFADAATGNLERVLRWWADEGTLEDVTIARAFVGKDQIRDYLRWYFAALPDVRYQPIRLVIDGPTAVVEWQQTARVVGEFDGVGASGVEMNFHAIDMFHIEDGRVLHEVSWYGDGWFRQRLEGKSRPDIPPPLAVTPPVRSDGQRFESSRP